MSDVDFQEPNSDFEQNMHSSGENSPYVKGAAEVPYLGKLGGDILGVLTVQQKWCARTELVRAGKARMGMLEKTQTKGLRYDHHLSRARRSGLNTMLPLSEAAYASTCPIIVVDFWGAQPNNYATVSAIPIYVQLERLLRNTILNPNSVEVENLLMLGWPPLILPRYLDVVDFLKWTRKNKYLWEKLEDRDVLLLINGNRNPDALEFFKQPDKENEGGDV